jgi:hypothetical protein
MRKSAYGIEASRELEVMNDFSRPNTTLTWFRIVSLLTSLLGSCSAEPSGLRGVVGTFTPAPEAGIGPVVGVLDSAPDAGSGVAMPRGPTPITTQAAPVLIDQTGANNPAGLSEADVKDLVAGGPLGKLRWLYPYPETVFPGGTLAPTLMWEGDPETEAIYLRIKSQDFEFKTVIKPQAVNASAITLGQVSDGSTPLQPQFQVPQEVWDLACQKTRGKGDAFSLELSARVKGVVAGPIVSRVGIAQGTLKGSIYYTTYAASGTLMRIPPRGKAQPLVSDLSGTCTGCHAISANGNRVIVQALQSSAAISQGFSFQLDPGRGAVNPRPINGPNAGMAAVFPDGSKYLAQSQAAAGFWTLYSVGDRLNAALSGSLNTDAALYDAVNGQLIPGSNIPAGAFMPMFSPDGTRLVFNDAATGALDGLRRVAIMDFDTVHNKASGYKALVQEDANSGIYPAWPSFLPDNKAVLFVRTNSAEFSSFASEIQTGVTTFTPALTGQTQPDTAPRSDLYLADVASGKTTLLAKAMGFDSVNDFALEKTYLPHGASDLHHNYNTTVAPIAAGGYFWVFFDSPRNYGNLGLHRGIWGAAIDIQPNGSYTTDPSHPPFYFPGQEWTTNHRVFAARDLCRADGEACSSGVDCCTGFCSAAPSGPQGACTPPPPRCANLDEHCASSTDCCGVSNSCINNFCSYVELL